MSDLFHKITETLNNLRLSFKKPNEILIFVFFIRKSDIDLALPTILALLLNKSKMKLTNINDAY